MRVWVAVCAVLFATVASGEPLSAPDVPPLIDGEAAPADPPNYFDAKELGAGTVLAYAACADALATADGDDPTTATYCSCVAEAARLNVRRGGDAAASDAQISTCSALARGIGPAAPASRFATPTSSIIARFHACVGAMPEGASLELRGFACSCATDAWITDRASPKKLQGDLARCVAAARYRDDTGLNPTLRQFRAIAVARPVPRARSIAPSAPPTPEPGAFIPYEGNGGGPTLCSDGMYSHSSGRGTCSHHGGIAGGRHRRR